MRSLATNEERQRLAREIHDGVAQELVMVGYGIDNALATLPDDATVTAEELRLLRSEVTRVITELRLSLFELRADVERQGGLSAAISEYARTVGAAGGMRVNLTMVDSTARLPASVEAELLPHRPGGDHERPQACGRAEPLGKLRDRPAVCSSRDFR